MNIGPQFKLLIGLIQVAIMVELGIQVQLSARKLTPEEADQKVSKLRTWFKIMGVFFCTVGVCQTTNNFFVDKRIFPDPKQWNLIVHQTLFPVELILMSILLCSAYVYLSANIKKHFAKELAAEGKKIRAIFVLFAVSYISRATVYLLCLLNVIEHQLALSFVMQFFWDVLPLSSIMIYHLKAFRKEEKERNKPAIDWTRQSNAWSSNTTNIDTNSDV